MRLRTTGILAIALLLMGLSASRMGYAGTEAPAAPAFDIVTLPGDSYSRDSLKGQPALLIFWAPWCQVCQRELPELAKFYQNDKPKSAPLAVRRICGSQNECRIVRESPLGDLCLSHQL